MAKQKTKTPMPMQDADARSRNFSLVELGYTDELALQESDRCVRCKKPACVPNCPVEIDIRAFVQHIQDGNIDEAYYVMTEKNLFPAITGRVCPQEEQCEKVCVMGIKHEPVGVGFLEKYVGDYAREHGLRPKVPEIQSNGKSIAIIGSGPAGMSAAADLVKMGYKVTMYEAFHTPGGVLMYGIPEFWLPKDIVQFEIDNLTALGVEIVCNALVGRTITMAELKERFDAIFIGTGAGFPWFLNIPGENLNGVYSANEFLTRANLMNAKEFPKAPTPINVGDRVAVIGGGNTAMDAARVARRLGADSVDIVYRRTRAEMPARNDEIEHAAEEGINFEFLTAPIEIHGTDEGWVNEMEMLRMELGEPDDSGRRRPVTIEGSNYRQPYDTVIMAVGQSPNPLLTSLTPELPTTKWGNIIIESDTLRVSVEDGTIICAGGDIIGNQAGAGGTVIAAMGHGKVAARNMHQALGGIIEAVVEEA